MRLRARLVTSSFAALGLFGAGDVAAQTTSAPPSEDRCLAAYENGQRLRLKHALREARAELLLCAREPCPASFRPECLQWFDEVEKLVPSVIVHVQGGGATTEVRVLVDGVVIAERLDGSPLEIDPGEHTFRFEPKGAAPVEQKVLVNEGEKARVLTVDLAAPATPDAVVATPDSSTAAPGAPVWPWIAAGVGTVALGSFAFFGLTGLSHRRDLEACDPYCKQSDVDATHRRFVFADVSLAVSVVSFGLAAWGWWSSPSSSPATSSNASIHFEASAGPHAAFAAVGGAF